MGSGTKGGTQGFSQATGSGGTFGWNQPKQQDSQPLAWGNNVPADWAERSRQQMSQVGQTIGTPAQMPPAAALPGEPAATPGSPVPAAESDTLRGTLENAMAQEQAAPLPAPAAAPMAEPAAPATPATPPPQAPAVGLRGQEALDAIRGYNDWRARGQEFAQQNPDQMRAVNEAADTGWEALQKQLGPQDQSSYEGFLAQNQLRAARPETNAAGYNDIARARSRAETFAKMTPEQFAARQELNRKQRGLA